MFLGANIRLLSTGIGREVPLDLSFRRIPDVLFRLILSVCFTFYFISFRSLPASFDRPLAIARQCDFGMVDVRSVSMMRVQVAQRSPVTSRRLAGVHCLLLATLGDPFLSSFMMAFLITFTYALIVPHRARGCAAPCCSMRAATRPFDRNRRMYASATPLVIVAKPSIIFERECDVTWRNGNGRSGMRPDGVSFIYDPISSR